MFKLPAPCGKMLFVDVNQQVKNTGGLHGQKRAARPTLFGHGKEKQRGRFQVLRAIPGRNAKKMCKALASFVANRSKIPGDVLQ